MQFPPLPARGSRAGAWLWLSLCLLLALTSMQATRAHAATYYVAANGSDSNNGSAAYPFRQIRKALPLLKSGDTVLVGNGSYLGFTMYGIHGTATAPITIQATGANVNVTVTTDRPDNRDTILVSFCSYIVLNGLNAYYANRAGVRIDQSPNITVCNAHYGHNYTWGIFTDFSDNLLIENNTCFGSRTQHGIYVSNSCSNPVIEGNIVHDNHDCGIQLNGDKNMGGSGLILGAWIGDNVIYNNGAGGGAAINMDGVQNSTVCNNLLFNNYASGIMNWRYDGAAGPSGMQILNNTLDMPSGSRWALTFFSSAGPNYVRNNILLNEGTYRGGLQFATATDVNDTNCDYNILSRVTVNSGNSVLTLAQWQATGHDLHSRSASLASLFVHPSGGNYTLLSTAPAVNRGEILAAVPIDITGFSRPYGSSTDIGCYEWHP